MNLPGFCLVFTAGVLALPVRADVMPASLFQDHAVLQQGCAVPVWGTAAPGENITVTYTEGATVQSVSATAGANGRWRADLPALAASSRPGTLAFAGNNTVTLNDILVGEVWLCSGQSNMEFVVKWASNAQKEIATADHPLIRHFAVPKASSPNPSSTVKSEWKVCSPASAPDFTAVGYYFARELQQKLGVPVGLLNSSYGGTPVESWMSEAALKSDPAFAPVLERMAQMAAEWPETLAKYRADAEAWQKGEAAAKAAGQKWETPKPRYPMAPGHPFTPMVEYNAMIHPLVPYALRGAIWYQGEANVSRASEYRALFSGLIAQWRGEWGQGDFPFYFVQLANFKADDPQGTAWPSLREAQAQTLKVPNTGMAVAIDIGNSGNIHPGNKQEVGRRLARLALCRTYGDKGVVDSGPAFVSSAVNAGPPATVRVQFSGLAAGLKNRNTAKPEAVLGFELAGEDKIFQAAEARIEDAAAGTVLVAAPDTVPVPVYVRYAWRNDPPNSLANSEDLPAPPFRTDP
jgi:sialate O-acetylesterase